MNRLLTWNEAQHHCGSQNMTLFQYDNDDKFYKDGDIIDYLVKAFIDTGTELGDVVFLGLKRNKVVNKIIF